MSPGKTVACHSQRGGGYLVLALIDYNPASYHSVPPAGSDPLLGKFGVILADISMVFSAWELGCSKLWP